MKIGILTFHNCNNLGALLQAYALKETIKSINNEVQIIDYRSPYIKNNLYKLISINSKSFLYFIKSILFSLTRLPKRIVLFKFDRFRKKFLSLSKERIVDSCEINNWDTYIVGSDQVWNGKLTQYDSAFFLNFCSDNNNKISYAASIGEDDLDDVQKAYMKENINNIDLISVRERSAIEHLRNYTNKDIYHTLDPTLLANKTIWDKLVIKKNNSAYLLIYRVSANEEVFKIAEQVSKILNLKILHINNYKSDRQGVINIRRVGPKEFVSLFNNASFIVTNSFHGTTFSIIFNKDFITVPHKKRGTRMVSLLHLLKLEDRLKSNAEQIGNDYCFQIDYEVPNKILTIEREKSMMFLHRALER